MGWVLMAMGALVLSLGVFVIRNRDDLARWQAREVRRRNGWNAEIAARNTTPAAMIAIGTGAIIIGLAFVGVAVLLMLGVVSAGL